MRKNIGGLGVDTDERLLELSFMGASRRALGRYKRKLKKKRAGWQKDSGDGRAKEEHGQRWEREESDENRGVECEKTEVQWANTILKMEVYEGNVDKEEMEGGTVGRCTRKGEAGTKHWVGKKEMDSDIPRESSGSAERGVDTKVEKGGG